MGRKFVIKQYHQKLIKHSCNVNKVVDLILLLLSSKTTIYSAPPCQKPLRMAFSV